MDIQSDSRDGRTEEEMGLKRLSENQMGQIREKALVRIELMFVTWEIEWPEVPSIEGRI